MAEQRSNEWVGKRAGRITASRMSAVMAVGKKDGKPLQAYRDYLAELVVERLTGEARGIPTTHAMQWGIDCEPHARAAAEARHAIVVCETDFIQHPDIDYVGASPDGLIGQEDTSEIKCPYNSIVHIETIIAGEMPEDHIPQVQGQLWVTGRKRCLFVSFDPRMPAHLRLFTKWIPRDDAYIAKLVDSCTRLNAEVQQLVAKLSNLPRAA